MILQGSQIWRWMDSSASLSRHKVWIASAYITSKQFEELNQKISKKNFNKKIFVRWQLRDLISGSSDLQSYKVAQKYGWRFFVNLELHAKTYLYDNLCAIGSANLTTNGMKGISPGNIEMLAKTTDLASVASWFMALENTSMELNDELFFLIEKAVQESHLGNDLNNANDTKYDESLLAALSPKQEFSLFTHDLFWSTTSELLSALDKYDQVSRDLEHDFSLLGINHLRELEQIKMQFLETKAFHWILNNVEDQAYFGELSAKLHLSLQDDPAPFRKDVKILLNNLLEWTGLCGGDYFTLDRPNISQRIKRK